MYLLPGFVMLYTHGVTDADYFRPVFSAIIIMAEYIYCVRDPYDAAIYDAGKFKETAVSAYIEAGINIVLSVTLVNWLGLEGIAIGTFTGMTFRMIYMIVYLSKNVVYRSWLKPLKRLLISGPAMLIAFFVMRFADVTGSGTWILWFKNAFLSVAVFGAITLIADFLFDRQLITPSLLRKTTFPICGRPMVAPTTNHYPLTTKKTGRENSVSEKGT